MVEVAEAFLNCRSFRAAEHEAAANDTAITNEIERITDGRVATMRSTVQAAADEMSIAAASRMLLGAAVSWSRWIDRLAAEGIAALLLLPSAYA